MKQFVTNYFLEDSNGQHVFSRIFIFHNQNTHKFDYVEIYSINKLLMRKNLSSRMVQYFLSSRWNEGHPDIGCYVYSFKKLEELDKEINTYMPRNVAQSVCNWVKEEIG